MEWVFFRNISGQWCWQCRANAHVLKGSRRSFGTRRDCVADAMRYGFLPGPLGAIEPVVTAHEPSEAVH